MLPNFRKFSFSEVTLASHVCLSGKNSTQIKTSMELLWTSDQPVAEAATYITHSKYKRRTSVPSEGFESTLEAITCVQLYTLYHKATEIGRP
jgi:hypothetical protein